MISAERIRILSPQQRELLLQRLTDLSDAPVEREIVAYIVGRPGHTLDAADLRNSLRSRLPEFMIPAQFIFLPSLPRNPNGKVDRNALPAYKTEQESGRTALIPPRTETEAKLIAIWSEVLRVENVGVEDNFFRLGGHSLLALQVMARVRDTFKMDLPLKTLFESPTVAALAEALQRFSTQPATRAVSKIPRRNTESSPDTTSLNPTQLRRREHSRLSHKI